MDSFDPYQYEYKDTCYNYCLCTSLVVVEGAGSVQPVMRVDISVFT